MPDAAPATPGTHRLELPVTPADAERVAAELWAAGALGVWEQPDRLVAWFATRPTTLAAAHVDARWSIEPDRDWQAEWKATIEPVHAGRTTIVPSWLADDHVAAPGERTIVMDPGRAFGSGHHATTCLCLELLDELELDGRTVADIGCGTGVLAIAAALQGADAAAVDIDPAAVEVARDNADRNEVHVDVRAGSVEALPGPADVVVANLVTDVIVTLAADLVAATRATLVVSGIATERRERVRAALEEAGAAVVDVRERDGWLALRAEVRS